MVKDGWDWRIFCRVEAILLPDELFKVLQTVPSCQAELWMGQVGLFGSH